MHKKKNFWLGETSTSYKKSTTLIVEDNPVRVFAEHDEKIYEQCQKKKSTSAVTHTQLRGNTEYILHFSDKDRTKLHAPNELILGSFTRHEND